MKLASTKSKTIL